MNQTPCAHQVYETANFNILKKGMNTKFRMNHQGGDMEEEELAYTRAAK